VGDRERTEGSSPMTSYCRVMLGDGNDCAAECFAGGFISAEFEIRLDVTGDLPGDIPIFNERFIRGCPDRRGTSVRASAAE